MRISTLLLLVFLACSCTSEQEERAFIGNFILEGSTDTFLDIKSDYSFETNCSRFSCKTGVWDVSALPTAMGIVITFSSTDGEFCEQLHWKESEVNEVLESQETDPQYVRYYKRRP